MQGQVDANCCICLGGIGSMILFILSLTAGLNYATINTYVETQCKIVRVLPNPNSEMNISDLENNNLWVNCDCGRHCTSKTYCNKIFGYDINNPLKTIKVFQKSTINEYNDGDICTYRNDNCDEGGLSQLYSYNEGKDRVRSYFRTIGTNETVPCWVHKDTDYDDIYINNEYDVALLIVFCSLFFLFLICLGGCIYSKHRERSQSSNKYHNKDIESNSEKDEKSSKKCFFC